MSSNNIKGKRHASLAVQNKKALLERCRKRILENRRAFFDDKRKQGITSNEALKKLIDAECTSLYGGDVQDDVFLDSVAITVFSSDDCHPLEVGLSEEDRIEILLELQKLLYSSDCSAEHMDEGNSATSLRDLVDAEVMGNIAVQEMEEIDSLVDFFFSTCSTEEKQGEM